MNTFLSDHLPGMDYSHVFLTGSFVTRELREGSDLDLDIISPNTVVHEVNEVLVEGIVIEYATFSFRMIEEMLEGNTYEEKVLLAKAVTNWKIIAGKGVPHTIVCKAHQILSSFDER